MMRLLRWVLWAFPALAACTYTGHLLTFDVSGAVLSASTTPVWADGHAAAQVTLTLQGAHVGTSLGNVSVRFATADGTPVVLTPATAQTNAAGVATAAVTSLQPGGATLTAYVIPSRGNELLVSGTVVVSFVTPPASAATSTLTANPTSVVADGATPVTVTVTAFDAYSNRVPNAFVSFTSSDVTDVFGMDAGVTDANGVFSTWLTSTSARTKTLTATVGNFILTDQVTFLAGPVSAHTSIIGATPAVDIISTVKGLVTVQAEDAYGNPIARQAVTFSAASSLVSFTPSTGMTDGTGAFDANVTASGNTIAVLQAALGGQVLSTPAVTFFTGSPNATQSTLQLTGNPTANGNGFQAVVMLRDELAYPLPTYPFSITATNTASPPFVASLKTDAAGASTVNIASIYTGLKHVTVNSNNNFTLTGTITVGGGITTCSNAGFFANQPPMVANINNPMMVTTALMNSDAYKDLVFVANNTNQIGVALGQGNGRFQTPVFYASGGGAPNYLAVCDLTGTGGRDVVVVNQSNGSFAAFLGNANGVLAVPKVTTWDAAGLAEAAIGCADVTRDGKADVIVNDTTLSEILVFPGNGDGTFASGIVTSASSAQGITVADVSGDGNNDVIYPDGNANIVVLVNRGIGLFNPPVYYPAAGKPLYVGAADITGDGHPDLVASTQAGTLVAYKNNGTGAFTLTGNVLVGAGAQNVAFGDFNLDGNMDVVAPTWNSSLPQVYMAMGLGNGNFTTAVAYRTANLPYFAAVDKINSDAVPDVVVGDVGAAAIQVTLAKGDGTLYSYTNYSMPTYRPEVLVAQDVTDDGNIDIVLSDGTSALSNVVVMKGAGDGTFTVGPASPFPGAGAVNDIAVADLNDDGLPDVIGAVVNSPGGLAVLLNRGNGAFNTGTLYPAGNQSWGVGVADFDGDGVLDIATGLAGSTESDVSVLLGQGGGTFGAATQYSTGSAAISVSQLTVQDINADGHPDLVASFYNTRNISVLLGNGNGTFQTGVAYMPSQNANMGGVAAADFNNDGYGDVASFDNSGNACVYLGHSNGTVTANACYGNNLERPYTGFAADINGDGDADLIAAGHSQGTIIVFRGQGTGVLLQPDVYVTGLGPVGVVAADFNKDNMPDIAVANTNEPSVSIHLQTPCP